MTHTYQTRGTCSRQISFELDEEKIVRNVKFIGGCSGNQQGISALVEGQNAQSVIEKLEGIRCGFKSTSCPDQLTKALREALEEDASADAGQE